MSPATTTCAPSVPATIGAAAGADSARRPLTFDRPVPRASVHKSADREVLITDARRLTGDRYAVAARWSRNHLLGHRPEALTSDPLLLVETVRQAAIHLAHRFLDVPAGHPFVMQDLDFELFGDRLPGGGRAGLPVLLDATCVRRITGRRFRFALEATLLVDGVRCARMGVRWEVLPPGPYALLRERAGCRAGAAPVGRPLPPDRRDVVLADDPALPQGSWRLLADPTHPVLFDHPCDHVPGTVLLEALRQAAGRTVPGWSPTDGRLVFHSFGEHGREVTVSARVEDGRILTLATQDGRQVASALFDARTVTSC